MTTPERLTDTDLARLELANELSVWVRSVAISPRGTSGREGSVAWFASDLPFAAFNQVLPIGEVIDPAELGRSVAMLRGRGLPFQVRVRAGRDDVLTPELERLGLREDPDEALPGMVAHPIDDLGAGLPAIAGLEIRHVDDEPGLDDHLVVVAEAFGLPIDLVRQLFPPASLGIPGMAVFVGLAEGRLAATAFGFTEGPTVGVYSVATMPKARRRGYGAALTSHVVADGRARGASVATLQSSAMGRPVYESLGFREVVSYRIFTEDRSGGGQDR